MDDLYTQETSSRRQRLLADLLRKQAVQEQYVGAPGQMVSGRYVAPSWAQSLNQGLKPFAAERQALQQEGIADASEAQYNQGLSQARQQWQDSAPTIVPGRAALPGPQAEGGSPELDAVAPQIPNRSSVLQHAIRGMSIPGNAAAAEMFNKGMGQEIDREDRQTELARMQTERQAESGRLQTERLAQQQLLKFEQLSQQEAALRERLKVQTDNNIRDNETSRQHNEAMQALRAQANIIAAMRLEAKGGSDKIDAKAQAVIDKDATNLSKRMGPLNTTINAAQEVQNLLDAYRDPKTGLYKPIPGIGRETALPGWTRSVAQQAGLLDEATNPNFAVVNRLLGDIMRQQAGLSQTISEQARVIATNLASGSYTQKEFIDNWGALQKAINNDLNNLQAGHSDEAIELFQKRGGKLDPVRSAISDTPSAAEQATARAVGLTQTVKQRRLEELRRKQAGGQ